jgi:fucose permease
LAVGDPGEQSPQSAGLIRALTFTIFLAFAMTTDAVGVIIPRVLRDLHLSMTAAGVFQYASQGGVAIGGLGLGFLADRLGRKGSILLGLSVFAADALLFGVSRSLAVFSALMFVSGLSVGVFKTGALALIGDISPSPKAHTRTMNMVEAFFAVGAILGPLAVTLLLSHGASWKWLYVGVGAFCVVLIGMAARATYPRPASGPAPRVDFQRTLAIATSPWALGFGSVIMLYVGVEAAVCVWMPTLLMSQGGPALLVAAYALPLFFGFRALGRFAGYWVLARWPWTLVAATCSFGIVVCFALALTGGRTTASYALPASGLFMSLLYPTLNSKGISCFPRGEHGAASGVLLFFTCLSGVLTPLAMGLLSDRTGDPDTGFMLAAGLAGLLFLALFANCVFDPSRGLLSLGEEGELPFEPGQVIRTQIS